MFKVWVRLPKTNFCRLVRQLRREVRLQAEVERSVQQILLPHGLCQDRRLQKESSGIQAEAMLLQETLS